MTNKAVIHRLKCWPEYFKLIKMGLKKFELRKNDRNYQVGHRLLQQEWDPARQKYTGQECLMIITHIFDDIPEEFGLKEGFIIMNVEFFTKAVMHHGPPAYIQIKEHLFDRMRKRGVFTIAEARYLCKGFVPYSDNTIDNTVRTILKEMIKKGTACNTGGGVYRLHYKNWKIAQ